MIELRQIASANFMLLSYILTDTSSGGSIVVDPPFNIRDHVSGLDVRAVINTHLHPDHTMGNHFFRGQSPVLAHPAEKTFVLRAFNAVSNVVFTRRIPAPVEFSLDGSEEITLGDTKIRVIHTPGHSPGSICLYWPGNLVSGDTVFAAGIGRTDIPGGSSSAMKNSIKKILELPGETTIWPGHSYDGLLSSTISQAGRSIVLIADNLD